REDRALAEAEPMRADNGGGEHGDDTRDHPCERDGRAPETLERERNHHADPDEGVRRADDAEILGTDGMNAGVVGEQPEPERGSPTRPQPKPNMKRGVQAIWRTSDVVDHTAGTRTLPSPRMTLSNMPPRKVMAAPPKSTRAKSVALARTGPLAPMSRNSGAAH